MFGEVPVFSETSPALVTRLVGLCSLKFRIFILYLYLYLTVGENLFTAPGKREEALSYNEFAIGVHKDEKCSLLVGHLPIEISNLFYHFLKKSSENKIIVKITGRREREIGLIVPANFVYITKDKNCSIILEAKL